jgi:hypothetical protein
MSARRDPYLAELEAHAAETLALFSNGGRHERERKVVRAFLRSVGIKFTEDEIRTGADEPVDIAFRDARFQIMDIVGGRRRGRQWKDRQRRYAEAKGIAGVMEPWTNSEPMSLREAARMIADSLAKKAARYGARTCSQIDALVYVDLGGHHLWPLHPPMEAAVAEDLRRQSWRSVSMLFVPYGAVLAVRPEHPEFLRDKAGLVLREWPGPGGWFDL